MQPVSMWKEDGQEEAWGLGIRFLSRRRLVTQTLLYDGMVLHAQPETPSLLTISRKGDLGSGRLLAADRWGSRQSMGESQGESLSQADTGEALPSAQKEVGSLGRGCRMGWERGRRGLQAGCELLHQDWGAGPLGVP